MSKPDEKPNPERRSDAALLCLCMGIGLLILAQFLGAGVVLAAAFAGQAPVAAAGGLGAFVGVVFAVVLGVIFVVIGGVWLIVRVIADARADSRERYSREVER